MAENTLEQWKLCRQCNQPSLQELRYCSRCGGQSWESAPAIAASEEVARSGEPDFGDRIPWTPLDVLKGVVFAIAFTVSAVALFVLLLLLIGGEDTGILALAATAAVEALLLVTVWLFAISKYRISWRALGFQRGPNVRDVGFAAAVVIVGLIVQISYLTVLEAVGIDTEGAASPTFLEGGTVFVVLLALLALLVAPVCEELFFRGFVLGGLTGRFGFWKAATISSLLFGLAHVEPIKIFPLFVLGLLLAGAYYRSRQLWSSVLAHFLNNGIALLSMLVVRN